MLDVLCVDVQSTGTVFHATVPASTHLTPLAFAIASLPARPFPGQALTIARGFARTLLEHPDTGSAFSILSRLAGLLKGHTLACLQPVMALVHLRAAGPHVPLPPQITAAADACLGQLPPAVREAAPQLLEQLRVQMGRELSPEQHTLFVAGACWGGGIAAAASTATAAAATAFTRTAAAAAPATCSLPAAAAAPTTVAAPG